MLNLILIAITLLVQPAEPVELLPGIRVADGVVEFDAEIAIDAHHPETPDVYLEMFITAPDSREHESLLVAKIKPSNLHAALLAAGFESGAPLTRDESGNVTKAHGDPLRVLVSIKVSQDEAAVFIPITDWVMQVETETSIIENEQWEGLVFAGSKLTRRGYEADGTGTLVSLTSFSNEVIAPAWTLWHEADIDEPIWIANRELLPKKGQKVIVQIIAPQPTEQGDDSHEPERVNIDRDP